MLEIVVKDGRLVDETGVKNADLGISDGRIVEVGEGLDGAETVVDASGKWVLPGGLDSHVHLDQLSSKGDMTADDFTSGSRSAIHGGTTTVVPFAAQHRGMSISKVLGDAFKRAETQMVTDYGMHLIVTEFNDVSVAELERAAEAGISAVKIYLTYDRLKMVGHGALDVMNVAERLGLPVMVHAESDAIVGWSRNQLVAAGQVQASSHATAHSRAAEWAGVAEALALAETSGATLYLAHLSTPEALDLVQTARGRGTTVVAETCPHYLLLDESALEAPIADAAPFMCSPPLRGKRERDGLIEHLAAGHIDIVASDHSPYTMKQKLPQGSNTPFSEVANGLPGIELRIALLWTLVATGQLTHSQLVAVTSTNPARVCGMFPKKGSLEVGADGDVVVWGENDHVASWEKLHDQVGYTPYEGMTLAAWPEVVISRGEMLVEGSSDHTAEGRGRFVGVSRLG